MKRLVPLCLLAFAALAAADDFLPPAEVARAAIEALPEVRAAQARFEESNARSDALEAGPYGVSVGVMPSVRHEHGGPTYSEWEASLNRPLRLPGKARIDRALGQNGIEIADLSIADARHAGARALLDHWLAWLRSAADADVDQRQLATLKAELAAVETRARAGDLATLDVDRAAAAVAQAEAAVTRSLLERDQARLALVARFPLVTIPVRLPSIPLPDAVDFDAAHLVERVVGHNHEIEIARALAGRQQLVAQRADADRIGDPSVGLRIIDEASHNEQAFGLVFSMPLSGAARAATSNAEAHRARAAEADAELVETEVISAAQRLAAALPARYQAWTRAHAALQANSAAFARVERAWQSGETGFADLALARRGVQDAERLELRSRIDAHAARASSAIDAHQLWIGEPAADAHHQKHDHGT